MTEFTYLHAHSHFSRGGGPSAPLDWCRRAAELGYGALGMADRSPLAGLPAFARAAQATGLHPIIGAELSVLLPSVGARKGPGASQDLALFARDRQGLANLFRLCSLAYANWPGREAPVTWDALADRAAGLLLVLLGADEAGTPSAFVGAPQKQRAELGALVIASFGDAAFVGVPHSGSPGDSALAGQVVKVAAAMGVPILALPTARYLHATDAPAYETLRIARARAGWPRADANELLATTATSFGRPGPYSLRPAEEAAALFTEWPQAVENVAVAVQQCAGLANWQPDFASPETEFPLGSLAEKGLLAQLGSGELSTDLRDRLSAEAAETERGGTSGAWLGLAFVAGEARRRGFPLGAPLGAAIDSVLGTGLGLSVPAPAPGAFPPISGGGQPHATPPPGVEIPLGRRDALLSALANEYGAERIVAAGCAVEIAPVEAVQAAASVLGIGGEPLTRCTAAARNGWQALSSDQPEAPAPGSRLARLASTLRHAPLLFEPDTDTVVVAPREAYGAVGPAGTAPIVKSSGTATWVPWPTEELCALGYPVALLRGSVALSTLDEALELARKYPNPHFSADDVDLSASPVITDGVKTMFAKGRLVGVPYLAAEVVKSWKGGLNLETLAALVARSLSARQPGPWPDIPLWVAATAGTSGIVLYKGQFDAVVQAATGKGPHEARELRLALLEGKAEAAQAEFIEDCLANGLNQQTAGALWPALCSSAAGLVARSLALAHARIALWSAAVKAEHPAAFVAAALSSAWSDGGMPAVHALADEARHMGVSILPPDVSQSLPGATLERQGARWAVRWGLAMLPGWDEPAARRFAAARPAGGFVALGDLAPVAAGMTNKQFESFVRSGACDSLIGGNQGRESLLAILPGFLEWARNSHCSQAQLDLFSSYMTEQPPPQLPERAEALSPRELCALRKWEESNLGAGFTPISEIEILKQALENAGGLRSRLVSTTQIAELPEGRSVYLLALLTSPRLVEAESSSDAEPMALAWLQDLDGEIELVAFPPNYKRHKHLWTANSLVIVTGKTCRHPDGETYLLCEHLAAYGAVAEEEKFDVKLRASGRSAASGRPAPASGGPGPSSEQSVEAAVISDNVSLAVQEPGTPSYRLVITMRSSHDHHADIDKMIALKHLLEAHPGGDEVLLRIPYGPETEAVTSAQLPMGVGFGPVLEREIADLLGPFALAVIKL